jgi:predicted GH43/DUF377 family glycosyl hydrolase
MKKYLLYIILILQVGFADPTAYDPSSLIVVESKMIQLDGFLDIYNPSLIRFGEGYLLSFRDTPDSQNKHWISYVVVVLLDKNFDPISPPQTLNTRPSGHPVPSQSEDARLVAYRDKIYLIYNDNTQLENPGFNQRRDIHIAELLYVEGTFSLAPPIKLFSEDKRNILIQKNWTPFEWNEMFLLVYSMSPHEILFPNLINGECYFGFKTHPSIEWPWGTLRGGTPALRMDDEYLSFFHSGTIMSSPSSWNVPLWHYFMGAYTFSADPPFTITKISPKPIVGEGFYTPSPYYKRVIFPAGFVVNDPYIHVAYGKDDSEVWIATLNKKMLLASLIPVTGATP